jgi:hypothetical protein
MRSIAPIIQNQKIDAAVDLAQLFFRTADYDRRRNFSGASDVKLAAVVPVILPMQRHGKMALWKAISAGAAANKDLERLRKRIYQPRILPECLNTKVSADIYSLIYTGRIT